MAKVQDVAKFFIGYATEQAKNGQGEPMTNLRLQQLLYLAQGWHLARYGKPLFEEEIKAWPCDLDAPEMCETCKYIECEGRNL